MPAYRYEQIANLQVNNERPPALTAEQRRIARLLENTQVHSLIGRNLPLGTLLRERFQRFVDLVQVREAIYRILLTVEAQVGEGTEEIAVVEEVIAQVDHLTYTKYHHVFTELAGPQGLIPRFPNIFNRNGRPTFVSEEHNPCSSCGFAGHFPINCSFYTCQICNHSAPGHLPEECPHAQHNPRREGRISSNRRTTQGAPTLILETVPPAQPRGSDADDSSDEEPGPPRRRRRVPPQTNGLLRPTAPTLPPSTSSGTDQILYPQGSPPPLPIPPRNSTPLINRISGNRTTAMLQEDLANITDETAWHLERITPGSRVDPRAIPLILQWREGRFVDMSGNEYNNDPTGQLVYRFNRPGGPIPGLDEATIRIPDISSLDGTPEPGTNPQGTN